MALDGLVAVVAVVDDELIPKCALTQIPMLFY